MVSRDGLKMDKGVLNRVHGEGRFNEAFDCIDMSIGIQRQKDTKS
jgi:hypothetical protein